MSRLTALSLWPPVFYNPSLSGDNAAFRVPLHYTVEAIPEAPGKPMKLARDTIIGLQRVSKMAAAVTAGL